MMVARTRPAPAGRSTFLLTRAKRETLGILADYFSAATNMVADVRYGSTEEVNDWQRRSTRRTLLILHREGLVARLPYLDLAHPAGGATFVHGLSEAGVRYAVEHGYASGATKTFDEHSARTLDHELLVTRVHREIVAFAARQHFDLYWLQRDLKRTMHPDAVFALTDSELPDDRNTRYSFLEVERAKAGSYRDHEPQIMRKLRAYESYQNSTACLRDWRDFRAFRVLVVVGTEARARALRESCRDLCDDDLFVIAPTDAVVSAFARLVP